MFFDGHSSNNNNSSDLPVAHEEGEIGFHRDARQDDAAVGIAVGQHLGHQHMGACQVLGGATALTQAAVGHLHNSQCERLLQRRCLFACLNVCSVMT